MSKKQLVLLPTDNLYGGTPKKWQLRVNKCPHKYIVFVKRVEYDNFSKYKCEIYEGFTLKNFLSVRGRIEKVHAHFDSSLLLALLFRIFASVKVDFYIVGVLEGSKYRKIFRLLILKFFNVKSVSHRAAQLNKIRYYELQPNMVRAFGDNALSFDTKRILMIGGNGKHKGFSSWYQMFQLSNIQLPIRDIEIYGQGYEAFQSNDLFHFKGPRSTELIAREVNPCFFLSVSSTEGFGIAIFEAISWGCIPLVPNNSAAAEYIADEKYFYDLDDVNSLLSRILFWQGRDSIKVKNDLSELRNKISYLYYGES